MGMGMLGFGGLHGFVIAILLLTVSFFVLLALQKAQSQGVKVFGYTLAVLLWICAALAFSKGIYQEKECKHYKKGMSHQMMKEKMGGGLKMDREMIKE